MLKMETLIDLAKQSQATQHRVSCASYDSKGRLISTAWNMPRKSHPIQAKYANKAGQPFRINLHAEILCLIRAREPVHRIQVVRIDRSGSLKPSFPCPVCMGYIQDIGVKEIVFHDRECVLRTEIL
jgi:tRNA(Arg) A34 adenosine deaminase TadA